MLTYFVDLLGIPDTSLSGLSTLAALKAFRLPALKTWSSGRLKRLKLKTLIVKTFVMNMRKKLCISIKDRLRFFKNILSSIFLYKRDP